MSKQANARAGSAGLVVVGLLVAVVLLCSLQLATAQQTTPAMSDMRVYFMGLLSRGPKATTERSPEGDRILAEHIKHIEKMAAHGKLVAAGPIRDDGPLRGIVILTVATPEEAKALLDADPAVKAGLLAVEVHPWFAQKGIGDKYFAEAKANPSAKIGMETYQLVLLKRGPNFTTESTPELQKLQAAHLANISKLRADGSMGMAGPFMDDGDLRGVFVFRVGSLDEAKALTETDPAVKAGRLAYEIHPWMAAKGTMP